MNPYCLVPFVLLIVVLLIALWGAHRDLIKSKERIDRIVYQLSLFTHDWEERSK